MKHFVFLFAVLGMLFACTPEEGNTGDNNGYDGAVHVTGISLDRPTVTIMEGESITLVATVTPNNATNKNITWSTSSEAIATVDNNGKVTGVKAGNATITATTEDGRKKATCSLTVEANLAPSVTVEANHISAISAVLAGKANLGSTVAADLKVGFQYSKSAGILPSNSVTVEATDADANYNYSTGITGLEPDTKYYFRSFVRQNGQDTYGDTKSFSTKDVTSLLETNDASDVEATSAKLNAKLDLTDVKYSSKSYGFYWGTSETTQNTKLNGGEIKDNAYSASQNSLSHKTQYWYKSYVTLDNQTFYGEVKTFTTDVVPVESVSLDKTEYNFHTIGNTLTLKATVLPADATDKSIEWSSDKEDVATVGRNGTVKAVGNGTATITVTTKDQGKTASCAITVAQWVTSIYLKQTSLTLNEEEEQTLTATVNPYNANDPSLTWTSSYESVAKVDQTGKVTAVSKGTATIRATANDGSGKYASCSVTVKRLVSSIILDQPSLVVYNGKTETITATVNPSTANNTSVTWSSSNTSVATVSSSGVVTGKSRGTATITVTANDGSGAKATCEVEVKQYVTSITLDNISFSLFVGQEQTLTATVNPSNANDPSLSWTSSDESVAKIDQTGKVTAVSKGTATIKATAKDGSGTYASCSITVKNPVPAGAVDLGLSVYWATRNLSVSGFVSSPEMYGDYYAWGETAPYYSSKNPLTWKDGKTGYNWASYSLCNGSIYTLTKYNNSSSYGTVDNKKEFKDYNYEDDAARQALGGRWRIPTDREWRELMTKCTWTWTSNYNNTGIAGRIVTSNVEGYKDKSIFLPAAGYRDGTLLFNVGYHGNYWSSSLNTSLPHSARGVDLSSGGGGGVDESYARCHGQSVRPVSE